MGRVWKVKDSWDAHTVANGTDLSSSFCFSGWNHLGYIIFWTPMQILLVKSSTWCLHIAHGHTFFKNATQTMHRIMLPSSMHLLQFTAYFRYQVHFLLFLFPVSDFLLACHICNSHNIFAGDTCISFTLGTWCISCYLSPVSNFYSCINMLKWWWGFKSISNIWKCDSSLFRTGCSLAS